MDALKEKNLTHGRNEADIQHDWKKDAHFQQKTAKKMEEIEKGEKSRLRKFLQKKKDFKKHKGKVRAALN
ncbi:hypothetical protein NECAME_05949 [Necator americanus]|uniref:Uncharacterized protein n=1 Tax=Necator americanus TaxID=51031 RepID=W2TZJ4_NECAM|nr:hypothetical protein NECAME_05949 [Necator americanus]ETN86457.1 hypothetical protein NECAME_05949 [Necator americanus]